MNGKIAAINSRKYDGSIRRTWLAELVQQSGELLLFVGVFDFDVDHPDLGFIRRGTVSYEYYWTDRWYNIFRFHEPNGDLRNYYCNINMPPTFSDGVLDYVDLDIDVVVWPTGEYKILDLEEFESNAAIYQYPEEVVKQARTSLEQVMDLVRTGNLPGSA